MRVIIAGGGTGGHLFSGVALAREIEGRFPDSKIIFVGTERGLENKVIPKLGYELKLISVRGFVGKSVSEKIKSLTSLCKSIRECTEILKDFPATVVFGVGGYASFPMVFVSHIRGIPTVILEQNSIPGLANKILGRFADAVAITYPETVEYFPKDKVYLTGTPVRKEIVNGVAERAFENLNLERGRFTLLIFGGSLGARRINQAVIDALPYLLPLREKIQIIHQTGDSDYEWVLEEYRGLSFKATVMPFIFDMADAYSVSDLVVCRAGASSVAEITALGKASILIPYPYAAYNHQELNARKLLSRGACEMILDRELSGEVLANKIIGILSNPEKKREIETASLAFGRLNAAERIVEIGISLIRRKE